LLALVTLAIKSIIEWRLHQAKTASVAARNPEPLA
jgi:ABC-type sulfate transport system permease subunit